MQKNIHQVLPEAQKLIPSVSSPSHHQVTVESHQKEEQKRKRSKRKEKQKAKKRKIRKLAIWSTKKAEDKKIRVKKEKRKCNLP